MKAKYFHILSTCSLFETISQGEVCDILKCLKPDIKHFSKNEFVAIAGSAFTGLGVVLDGSIAVTKETAAGDRVILVVLEPGELFGEIIAFSHCSSWPATVIAQQKSTVAFISTEGIISECEHLCLYHKQLISNMLKIVSDKALVLNKKVEYMAIKSLRAKVITYLIEQYKKFQKNTFTMPLNRHELAEFLSVTRPSLSREMGRMREEGLIDFHRSSVKILKLDLLKEQARY